MKIAVFSDNFYPELSGIADSVATAVTELGKRDYTIRIYVPEYSVENYKLAGLSLKEPNLGKKVSLYRLKSLPFLGPTKQSRAVIFSPLILSEIKKFKPDIIHSHLFFGAGLEALFVSKILKIPLVGTSHTPITEYIKSSQVGSDWLKKASSEYVSWYYNQCEKITAPSKSIIDEMKKKDFKRPFEVISNPIDLRSFKKVSSIEKKRLKKFFGFQQQTIFYAGRLSPEKKLEVIIQAVNLIDKEREDFNLAIAGEGSERKPLENLVKKLKLDKRVKFLGILSKKDLAKAYQASDIFVIMSTAETQSISLMQAMATELPVIGARARALPEYINSQNGFLVNPGDYQDLAQKILFLFKNPQLGQKMGSKGQKTVKNFSVTKIINQWEKFYQNIPKNKNKE